MRKEDKLVVIDEIAKTLQEYSCVYLTETAGLNAEKTSQLRRACFNGGVKLVVVKNTLLRKQWRNAILTIAVVSGACRFNIVDVEQYRQRSCQVAQGFH